MMKVVCVMMLTGWKEHVCHISLQEGGEKKQYHRDSKVRSIIINTLGYETTHLLKKVVVLKVNF